jgi:TolA-binding protein
MQALSQMSLGRFGSAMENLEAIEPGGLEASLAESILLAKASTAVGLQRPELAITLFTEFLRLYEDSKSAERVRADLMIAYAQSKQWRDAERQFEKLQLDAPQDGLSNMTLESCLLLAELALQEKRFALAESCFASLVKGSQPRDFLVRGLSGLAWARMNQGDEDASIAIFERLVVEHAESGLAAEAAMACGRYFEQRDQFDRAADMYRVVQAKYPDSKFESLARLREAYCLYKIGGQPNLRNAERLLTTAPQPVGSISAEFADEVAYQLAWIYMQTEREEMAMERFNEIAESMPDSRYWRDAAFRVAQNALSTGDLEKARRLIDKLDMLEMDSALRTRFEFLRGQVAVEDRDWVQVQQSMTDVLAATDEEALRKRARYWLAESLYQLRDFPAAIQELRRLVSNSELIAPNRLAWVNLRLAQSLAENEEWSAALQQAQSCKAKFPEFEAAHEFDFVIGRVHATQGRLTQARKAFQEVVNSPIGGTTMTAAMAQWRIGETYFHQQEYERAIEAFYRVDALFSYKHWRAAALVEAGKCHEHLGNWNHATRLYRRLIDLFPDSEFRLTAEQRLHSAQRQANRLDGQTK